ncbi:MAG: leucyl/phenylalanyl-tRNA--protein transferase [Phycisphaeraceae bacterium]|nr:leucyl/phenylalanyl-tRNA--protein transferase [Phycisphaeraceae bacterium]
MPLRDPLTPQILLELYRHGYFVMADPPGRGQQALRVYRPDPRAVLPLIPGGLHVPRTVDRLVRRGRFRLTSDRAFREVMAACAEIRPDRGGAEASWISDEMIDAYTSLHEVGHAHSIEAWLAGEDGREALVGGIYGVSIGAAFFAESMFCRPIAGGSGASSVCLVVLVEHLRRCGYQILDVQIVNPHTRRFGVVEFSGRRFAVLLDRAVRSADRWRPLA